MNSSVDTVRHQGDVGRRLHEESIQLQQRLAKVPLPREPEKRHPLLHMTAALIAAVVLVALALVLLPPGTG
jgi:hypothetical protein